MGIKERKAREFQKREKDILNAAIHLFTNLDWQTVTIEQITEQAEIGKGTIYKHFKTKGEIYVRIMINNANPMIEKWKKMDKNLDVVTRFKKMMTIMYTHINEVPAFQRKLTQHCSREDFAKNLDSSLQNELGSLYHNYVSIITELIEEGITSGVFPRQPIESMINNYLAAIDGAIKMYWRQYDQSMTKVKLKAFWQYYTDFILRGWQCKEELLTKSKE